MGEPSCQIKKNSLVFPILKGHFCLWQLCLLFAQIAHPQTSNSFKKDDYYIYKFTLREIRIAEPKATIQLTNIGGIVVMDARADTSSVGFMQKNTRKPVFLVLNNGLQQESQQFANAYCNQNKTDSSPTILMVIKKLWLTDGLDTKDQKYENNKIRHGDKMFQENPNSDTTSGMVLKIEFYSKIKLNYYALYRYDSTLYGTHPISYHGPEYLRSGLTESLSKLTYIDRSIYSIIANRKPFSLEEIMQHNNKSYDLPILKDTVFKNGVFMTFEEFKNNNPSKINFEVKKEMLNDMIYIKDPDGKEYPVRDIWGYSDGKNVFVKLFNNFFLLQRKENAFYIYGAKRIIQTGGSPGSTYMPPAPLYGARGGAAGIWIPGGTANQKNKLDLKPFQLDWDTGQLY